ncbi:MAG: type pilus assembly protein PilA [Thermoleophilaceae bacterium]|jgi:hypothetical protein|nr:type pilus assembly protein PilA [Thermoleophilaceae bacterium]
MGSRRIGVFLTVAALAVAGCGSDDDNDEGTGSADEEQAIGQDRDARGDARAFVTQVEICFAEQQDYTRCKKPDVVGGAGSARVERATATTFLVVASSKSGNEFRIEKTEAGALERTCETAGEAGCSANGAW